MSQQSGPNRRVLRVEREIHELVSNYIVMRLGSELEGLTSITRVIVSRDLRTAKALVYNQEGEGITEGNVKILQSYAPEIQQYINSQLRMKYCPRVHFIVDTKFESAMRVQQELHKLELERQNRLRDEKEHKDESNGE